MLVRVLAHMAGPNVDWPVGTVVDMPEPQAIRMIARGVAVAAARQAEVETAVAATPEVAASRVRPRTRRAR